MPKYTLWVYVYFSNMIYQPENRYRVYKLNQIPDMFITSPFNSLA